VKEIRTNPTSVVSKVVGYVLDESVLISAALLVAPSC
jgi:hypothetical protein